jgi:hypothetical protein
MARLPLNRFNGLRAIYVLTFVLIIAVFLILYWLIVSDDRKVESYTLCLETSECPTKFNEQMLGDFVRIPAGYFILPKHSKKTGYDIDSVYVNSFYLAVGKVSLDTYKSVYCPKEEDARVRSLNNSINHLEQKEIGVFLFRVNQLSDHHYRIPNDVEWMYAYQYLSESDISPKLQSEAPLKFHGIVSSFIQEPFEMCSWEGRREKGDTVSNFAFSEDLLSSKRNFITKGDIENIYNRDAQAFPSGIRLVRF